MCTIPPFLPPVGLTLIPQLLAWRSTQIATNDDDIQRKKLCQQCKKIDDRMFGALCTPRMPTESSTVFVGAIEARL
ncbi:hypothetical protein DFS33DRAFT_1356007 [Desarmillaria ectypa]|nr:hypothetical protein DFS33DRAFT_1356007 [Desarmillaria ectypa]